MDTIIVGDLHGQVEIARRVLKVTKGHYNVVFVGDYLDSFTRTPEEQFDTITTVVGAARFEPERVTALLANHERSYLYDEPCAGWNSQTHELVNYYGDVFRETLKDYVWVGDVLVTHAGVTLKAIPYKPDADDFRPLVEEFLHGPYRNMVGRARGGRDPVGGIYWCDFNHEFEPIPGIRQVFGHTRGNGIRTKGDNWCIDCLEDRDGAFLLVREDGVVDQIPVEDLI